MGGTYWYYVSTRSPPLWISNLTQQQYLLDGDVESYNEAEPATTMCPLLPGQPVNILDVPVILPDSRRHDRESSVSSQKSNYRTMNPEDKYLNPRQAPKPKLRLRSSPTLLQQPAFEWPFKVSPLRAISRSASQPTSPTRVKGQDARSGSSSKLARSLSPPRSRGAGSVFRHLNASTSDIESTSCSRGGPMQPFQGHGSIPKREGDGWQATSQSANRFDQVSSAKSVQNMSRLPLREPTPTGDTQNSPLSIQDRRALKSRSRETSPTKSLLRLDTQWGSGKESRKSSRITERSAVKESSPHKRSSIFVTAAKKLSATKDSITPKPFKSKEKRLPTLPNSPSSVMDEALRDLDAQERALDMEMLCSRFSDITTTDGSNASDSPCERSRFSEWSTDSDAVSPDSMTSSSTFNPENYPSPTYGDTESQRLSRTPVPGDCKDPGTPRLPANSPSSPISVVGHHSPIRQSLPHIGVSQSSYTLDIPEIYIDDADHVESNPKRHAAFFGGMDSLSALGLVRSPDPGTTSFSDDIKRGSELSNGIHDRDSPRFYRHSAPMQEMLDELSYLRNMIESGG